MSRPDGRGRSSPRATRTRLGGRRARLATAPRFPPGTYGTRRRTSPRSRRCRCRRTRGRRPRDGGGRLRAPRVRVRAAADGGRGEVLATAPDHHVGEDGQELALAPGRDRALERGQHLHDERRVHVQKPELLRGLDATRLLRRRSRVADPATRGTPARPAGRPRSPVRHAELGHRVERHVGPRLGLAARSDRRRTPTRASGARPASERRAVHRVRVLEQDRRSLLRNQDASRERAHRRPASRWPRSRSRTLGSFESRQTSRSWRRIAPWSRVRRSRRRASRSTDGAVTRGGAAASAAAGAAGLGHPRHGDVVRGGAVADRALVGSLEDEVGGRLHQLLQPAVHPSPRSSARAAGSGPTRGS